MVYVLMQGLSKKRVRLLSGELTPAFEYASQAFNYAEARNINHCRIIKVGKK